MGKILSWDVSQHLILITQRWGRGLDTQGRPLSPQILDMARQRHKRVKVVGGGHSPSDIACTDDFMIQMGKMNRVLKVRPAPGWCHGSPETWWHPVCVTTECMDTSAAITRVRGEGWRVFPLLTAWSSPKPDPEMLVHD